MTQPLSLKTSTAKTTLPLLADGIMTKLRLQQVHWTSPEETEKPYGIYKWEFQLTAPTAAQDGSTLNPGFPVFVNIMVGDRGDTPDWASVKEAGTRVSRILDGLLGTGDQPNTKGKPPRPEFPDCLPQIIGKEVVVKVKVKPNKNNPDQVFNEFSHYTYPPDVAG